MAALEIRTSSNHGLRCYEEIEPLGANYDLESIYVLCDAAYVTDVHKNRDRESRSSLITNYGPGVTKPQP